MLFIVVAIAGLVFGEDAANGAVSAQLGGPNGPTECGVASNSYPKRFWQVIWHVGHPCWHRRARDHRIRRVHGDAADLECDRRAAPRRSTVALLRSRATSLGLVAALGFLLLVSLVVSAILTALSNYINGVLPAGHLILQN